MGYEGSIPSTGLLMKIKTLKGKPLKMPQKNEDQIYVKTSLTISRVIDLI